MRAILLASATAAFFIGMLPSQARSRAFFAGRRLAWESTERAPVINRRRKYRSPFLVIGPSVTVPPVPVIRGVMCGRHPGCKGFVDAFCVARGRVQVMCPASEVRRLGRGP